MNHISTGDTLRKEIKNETEVGKIAKGIIDKGQLIPDDLMIKILAKTYDALPQGRGVIFDGFPRTIAQAEALKQMLHLVACHRAGLEYWGFEISPEYYEKAKERLDKERAQVNMMELVRNAVEQTEQMTF